MSLSIFYNLLLCTAEQEFLMRWHSCIFDNQLLRQLRQLYQLLQRLLEQLNTYQLDVIDFFLNSL